MIPILSPTEFSAGEVYNQVNRIVGSREFVRSKFLCAFLRYIVEQHLEGNDALLKEGWLGKTVFAREEPYNPSSDPIVRVQARRLRAKLTHYYSVQGISDPVLISVPLGSYVPHIRRRAVSQHVGEAAFHVAEKQAAY